MAQLRDLIVTGAARFVNGAYFGGASTFGSATRPIWWNNGFPQATTYSLSATLNAGSANRLAYYSGANAVSASSHYASATQVGINITNIDTIGSRALYVNGTSQFSDDIYANKSIRNLAIGGGLYWNPYVESATDNSDAASITLIKSGIAGGTELQIKQVNDQNDVINLVAPYYIYLNSKRAFTVNDSWLRINDTSTFTSGIYTGTSLIRTDNKLQVGDAGANFYAKNTGDAFIQKTLGIGGTDIGYTLYVKGKTRFDNLLHFENGIGYTELTTESRRSKNSSNADIETNTGLVTKNKSFIEIRGFAPPTMVRTTGDRPAPYGLGFGNGGESAGIMPIGDGDKLQELMFYGANSGPTLFTWKYQLWEDKNYDADYSNGYSAAMMSLNSKTGDLYVKNTIGINGTNTSYKLYVNGKAKIGDGTAATSASTGALTVNGGIGVSGNSYFSGSITVANNVLPEANNTRLLGNSSRYWKEAYITTMYGSADKIDGLHYAEAPYSYSNSYTQPTAGAVWYLKISTSAWNRNSETVYIRATGDNRNGTTILKTGSRQSRWFGWATNYNGTGVIGVKKVISSSDDVYIRLDSGTTSVTVRTTFSPTITIVTDADGYTDVPSSGGLFGNVIAATTFEGNASTATKLQTARTITIGNTAKSFNGTANVTWTRDEIGCSYAHYTSWDFTKAYSSNYVTFDVSSPSGGPGGWINAFVSTHNNYLSSFIAHEHRSLNWYVGWSEHASATNVNPTWYKLLHTGNYTSTLDSRYALISTLQARGLIKEYGIQTSNATGWTNTLAVNQFSVYTNWWDSGTYMPYIYGSGIMIPHLDGNYRSFLHFQCNLPKVWVGWVNKTSTSTPTWKYLWGQGDAVTSAVWNDYAECRKSDSQEPGYVMFEKGDDSLSKTIERLQHFAGIVSDTWGFSQGETADAKTNIAVAGRVLAYPYRDRNEYKPGDCVCAAPGGKVDIMTREEIAQYPDRIVGTVSCVPEYETWGGGELADRDPVKVNGRIWIKVK